MPVSGNSKGKSKSRWAAGVTPYKEMGYYRPDYEPKDSDILCAFRLVPQEGVELMGLGHQQRELLAADPGEGVHGAHDALYDLAQAAQHVVAGQVPVGVVDLLEVVHVEQRQ